MDIDLKPKGLFTHVVCADSYLLGIFKFEEKIGKILTQEREMMEMFAVSNSPNIYSAVPTRKHVASIGIEDCIIGDSFVGSLKYPHGIIFKAVDSNGGIPAL